jgi:uncharacterized protein YkwD
MVAQLVTLTGAILVAAVVLAMNPAVTPANARCRHADARPHETTLAKMRKAVICLVNHQRAKRGRHSLSPDRHLRRAAQRHTNRMLATNCFKHRCRGEPGLSRRIKRSGYLDGADAWGFAEDLGYESTPREMVNRLLRNRVNRRRMLGRAFRDIGVGNGHGTPVRGLTDSKFVTYTLVFAWRRPPG